MEAVGSHKKGFKLLRSNSKAIAHKTRMGFNLIEAAIVLAVVGGVIGGIWVSAAAVYENYKVTKIYETTTQIVGKFENLYSRMPLQPEGTWTTITNVMIATNAIPKDLVTSSVAAETPWGGYVSIASYVYSNTWRVMIRFDLSKMPDSACIKYLTRLQIWMKSRNQNCGISSCGGAYESNFEFAPYNGGKLFNSNTKQIAETYCQVSSSFQVNIAIAR